MNARTLLIVTALLETGTGVALLAVPSLTAEFLLGEGLTSAPALVVARVAGAALVSVGVACWLDRVHERRAQTGLLAGMLIYNLAVPLLLLHAWTALALGGPGLWPAGLGHGGLAAWCVVCLRSGR